MSRIAVAGGGAFGTALAIALAERSAGGVALWMRSAERAEAAARTRTNPRLPGVTLPQIVHPTADPAALSAADIVVIAVPTQSLGAFCTAHAEALAGRVLVVGAKGVETNTGWLPAQAVRNTVGGASVAVLSGPGFADEIAAGLPTAMTVAADEAPLAEKLREALSTPALRLYSSTDPVGVQAGGALKNVVAIACGLTVGAGLGENARAAVMTRGFAEMRRFALALGARAETLTGLSGFGDLALSCTSEKSRNYRHGLGLARGAVQHGVTVEGAATARGAVELAARHGVEMPLAAAVAEVLEGRARLEEAVTRLLARPRKSEDE